MFSFLILYVDITWIFGGDEGVQLCEALLGALFRTSKEKSLSRVRNAQKVF